VTGSNLGPFDGGASDVAQGQGGMSDRCDAKSVNCVHFCVCSAAADRRSFSDCKYEYLQ